MSRAGNCCKQILRVQIKDIWENQTFVKELIQNSLNCNTMQYIKLHCTLLSGPKCDTEMLKSYSWKWNNSFNSFYWYLVS